MISAFASRGSSPRLLPRLLSWSVIGLGMTLIADRAFSAACPESDRLLAEYRVTSTVDDGATTTSTLRLVRDRRRVAHERVDQSVTEVWQRQRNDAVRLTRFFDADRRAISYEPSDLAPEVQQSWDLQWRLVALPTEPGLQRTRSESHGCGVLERFSGPAVADPSRWQVIDYAWLPQLDLLVRSEAVRGDASTVFELVRYGAEGAEIDAVFASRQAFQVTDYADIGDSDDDLFLRRMIHLGFVAGHRH